MQDPDPGDRSGCPSLGFVTSSRSRGRGSASTAAVVARHDDPVLGVPDHPGAHAEVANRVLEVVDQLRGIEFDFGFGRDGLTWE
jgi:hypothetical protein